MHKTRSRLLSEWEAHRQPYTVYFRGSWREKRLSSGVRGIEVHGVAQIFISLCNLPTPHLLAFKTQTMPVLPKGSPGKKFKLPTRKALCMTTNMSAEKEHWCPPLLSNTSSSLPIFSLSSSPPPPGPRAHHTQQYSYELQKASNSNVAFSTHRVVYGQRQQELCGSEPSQTLGNAYSEAD